MYRSHRMVPQIWEATVNLSRFVVYYLVVKILKNIAGFQIDSDSDDAKRDCQLFSRARAHSKSSRASTPEVPIQKLSAVGAGSMLIDADSFGPSCFGPMAQLVVRRQYLRKFE